MKHFDLQLYSARRQEKFELVSAFRGRDASGSFGLLAGHARFMSALEFGLAQFRCSDAPWQYIALPGALARFADNHLTLICRRYVIDSNYEHIRQVLEEELQREEESLRGLRGSLHTMEQQMLSRLWDLGRQRGAP